jgi:hypothetical protein
MEGATTFVHVQHDFQRFRDVGVLVHDLSQGRNELVESIE